jgi:hypothetical protein
VLPTDPAAPSPAQSDRSISPEIEKLELEVQELRQKLRWDAKFGRLNSVLASLILVLGFVVGILQYNDARRQEFKRRFWEKQLETYSAVASSASRLSTLSSDSARIMEYDRFSQLYNGDFVLIADDTAFYAAQEYLQRYTEYMADPRKQDRTKRQSRAMANAFRYALAKNGDFPLTPLAPRNND